MNSRRGFLFIEFMFDLALIAILAGLMIVYSQAVQKNTAFKIAQQEMTMLKIAIISYHDHRIPTAYPPSGDSLCDQSLLKANPAIIRRVFYDPFSKTGQEYHYAVSPRGQHFCLWSIGRNRRSEINGIDDNGNVAKFRKCDDIYLTDLGDSY